MTCTSSSQNKHANLGSGVLKQLMELRLEVGFKMEDFQRESIPYGQYKTPAKCLKPGATFFFCNVIIHGRSEASLLSVFDYDTAKNIQGVARSQQSDKVRLNALQCQELVLAGQALQVCVAFRASNAYMQLSCKL